MDGEPLGTSLRPIIEQDLVHLERLAVDPLLSEPFEWRGFGDAREPRRRYEADGYLGEHDSVLAVQVGDDTFAGIVEWRTTPGPPPPGCLSIGILLLPEHRGRGHGAAAQRHLAEHLFATTTVHRLEAGTEVENVAEQRALERAGFRREGILRGRNFVRGAWRDYVMYSRLRDDPPPD